MANKDIDIRVKATDDGATSVINKTERAIDNLGKESTETGKKIDGAFKPPSVAQLPGKIGVVSSSIDNLKQNVAGLQKRFEGIRTFGAGLAVAGAGALLVSQRVGEMGRNVEETQNLIAESFGNSTNEIQAWGDKLQSTLKLNSVEVQKNAATFNVMFDSMGFAGDEALNMSKSLTLLANDMASFYNLSPDEAFVKLRAGITGEAEGLKALGILIDEQTIATYAYANGIAAAGSQLTQQQKVQARYGAIMEQTNKAQGDLSRTLDSSANVARSAGNAYEIAMQNIGAGSASAQKYVDNLLGHVFTLANGMPAVQKAAGAAFTWGAYGISAIGVVISVGSQVGLLTLAFPRLGVLASTAFTAIKAKAASTIPFLNGVTMAALGTKLGVAAIAIAAAATVGAVAYSIGQHIGWISKELTYVESLKLGWLSLADAISGAQNASLAKNAIDFKAEEAKVKTQYAKDRQAGMSEEAAGKKRDDALLALNRTFAKESNRVNDAAGLIKYQDQVDLLENTTRPIAVPVMPSMPAMPSMPSLPTVAAAMPINDGGTPWIDTSRPEPRAGGSLTIRPKTQVTQNAAGDYVLKILPTDVVIPNDFGRAVGAL